LQLATISTVSNFPESVSALKTWTLYCYTNSEISARFFCLETSETLNAICAMVSIRG